MRGLALLVMLVGCDGIWDLEHIEPVDASELPADLAAWFPMEEVAAGTILDVAGPHDGMCVSAECPQVTTGRIGNALAFDGATQIVKAPSSAALDTKRSFTVAVWVRTEAAVDLHACPVNKLYLGPETDNAWQFCAYGGIWHFYASPLDVLGPPVAIGTWQHLAATWDQATTRYRIYHNGLGVSEASGEPWLDDGGLVIGADIDAGQPLVYFPGAIDDVRIYTRALAGGEILGLANPQ